MRAAELPPRLARFVTELGDLLATGPAEDDLLRGVGQSMQRLVAVDDWLDPAFARPHPRYYQQYLLHADRGGRFSVVSFVWGPGQETPIHDHTVWGVIGMLRGAEVTQGYEIDVDGRPRAVGEAIELVPGAVEFVSPSIGDVHKVRNALDDAVSVSIHAYGADIGKVRRHVFPVEGGPAREFVSGYANV